MDSYDADTVALKEINIHKEVIAKIPAQIALHYKVVPVNFENGFLTVAAINPDDAQVRDGISLAVSDKLKFVLSSEKDILEKIRQHYGVGAETIEHMMDSKKASPAVTRKSESIEDATSEASVSKFVNQILLEAYKDRATDIHVEPFENELMVRYRIDGILYDAGVPVDIRHFKDSINSRIKIMANLDITEKRLPQDGRFSVKVGDIDLDLRVSFLPTPYGEGVVIRILNSTRLFSMEELGLTEDNLKTLDHLIKKPHGIVFLTGPTGSGKTTTLYSCLAKVNQMDRKIVTIEDPIEYKLRMITQIQINPAIGLTFSAGLRSMLRHDPDIMMVGEVRDLETAEIAIQVALTGHLVFSTLHTNDAVSGVTRLIDMGLEPYLITSSVECFIAQRLVRRICPHCKEQVKLAPDLARYMGLKPQEWADAIVYEGKGCPKCKQTGYYGREAIYEFFVLNDEIREMILVRAPISQIKNKAMSHGMQTLRQQGWQKVQKWITTASEVMRVTQEESI